MVIQDKIKKIISIIKQSLNGEQQDYTYYLAMGLDWKATGAFIAIPVAESLIALVAWYYFKKGKWKTVEV